MAGFVSGVMVTAICAGGCCSVTTAWSGAVWVSDCGVCARAMLLGGGGPQVVGGGGWWCSIGRWWSSGSLCHRCLWYQL